MTTEHHNCEFVPKDTFVYLAPLTSQWCVQQGDDETGERVVDINNCPYCGDDL